MCFQGLCENVFVFAYQPQCALFFWMYVYIHHQHYHYHHLYHHHHRCHHHGRQEHGHTLRVLTYWSLQLTDVTTFTYASFACGTTLGRFSHLFPAPSFVDVAFPSSFQCVCYNNNQVNKQVRLPGIVPHTHVAEVGNHGIFK